MPEPLHLFDYEFMKKLQEVFLAVYPSFEEQLQEKGLVRPSLEDYGAGEDLAVDPKTLGERWWLMSRGEVTYFLMKEKGYACNGTGIWLKEPEVDDVIAWFEAKLGRA